MVHCLHRKKQNGELQRVTDLDLDESLWNVWERKHSCASSSWLMLRWTRHVAKYGNKYTKKCHQCNKGKYRSCSSQNVTTASICSQSLVAICSYPSTVGQIFLLALSFKPMQREKTFLLGDHQTLEQQGILGCFFWKSKRCGLKVTGVCTVVRGAHVGFCL